MNEVEKAAGLYRTIYNINCKLKSLSRAYDWEEEKQREKIDNQVNLKVQVKALDLLLSAQHYNLGSKEFFRYLCEVSRVSELNWGNYFIPYKYDAEIVHACMRESKEFNVVIEKEFSEIVARRYCFSGKDWQLMFTDSEKEFTYSKFLNFD